jgi:hypothetical protein
MTTPYKFFSHVWVLKIKVPERRNSPHRKGTGTEQMKISEETLPNITALPIL